MKTILVAYSATLVGEKEFIVSDDFDIADEDAVQELLDDCSSISLVTEAELDELNYEDAYELDRFLGVR